MSTLKNKELLLMESLSRHKSILIAYSGGVDSSFLLWSATQINGLRVLGVLADSPSLARSEFDDALAFAEKHRLPLRVIQTRELLNDSYRANPANRCFYCKHELFEQLRLLAENEHFEVISYGENADDAGEDRPGRGAAEKFHVIMPLRDAGLTKADIRSLAREAGLEISDKAAQPCLSSRIPFGQEVTEKKLRQIDAAEQILLKSGFRIVRVRHREDTAFVQVSPEETPRLIEPGISEHLRQKIVALGFDKVEFDPAGYRGASLK